MATPQAQVGLSLWGESAGTAPTLSNSDKRIRFRVNTENASSAHLHTHCRGKGPPPHFIARALGPQRRTKSP